MNLSLGNIAWNQHPQAKSKVTSGKFNPTPLPTPTFSGTKSFLPKNILLSMAAASMFLPTGMLSPGRLHAEPPATVQPQNPDGSIDSAIDKLAKATLGNEIRSNAPLEEKMALLPLLQETTRQLKANQKVSDEQLNALSEATVSKLCILPDQAQQAINAGGKPYIFANLELQEALIQRLKARLLPPNTSSMGLDRLKRDLIWAMNYYPQAEIVQKASDFYVQEFITGPTLEDLNQQLQKVENMYYSKNPLLNILNSAKGKLVMAITQTLKELETQPDAQQSLPNLRTLTDTQKIISLAFTGDMTKSKESDALSKWTVETLNAPLAKSLRKALFKANTLEERLELGRIIANGVHLEGYEHAERGMRVLGLNPTDVRTLSPSIDKENRYGKVGPFTRMLLDMDRVAFAGDDQMVYGFAEGKEARDPMKRSDFNRNAVTAYLQAAKSLSTYSDDAYLVGLMTLRLQIAMEQDFYRIAHRPDPAVWGEHVGLYLGIEGGKREDVSSNEYAQSKIKLLKEVFLTGHNKDNPFKKTGERQEGLFEMYRWNRQYWLLTEKGLKDPLQDKEKAQEFIDDPAFQKELNQRVRDGWKTFADALEKTLPNYPMLNDLLMALEQPPREPATGR